MNEKKNELQMSEAFLTSIFLAVSGGFQDAYTYNTREEVFSNAQTGNVVLMSQNFMVGRWMDGLRYLFPLLAFAFGVFFAERIQGRFKYAKRLHWRQGILLLEIVILFAVGFIPQEYNMAATVLVSFACAMQVQTFRKVNGYSYLTVAITNTLILLTVLAVLGVSLSLCQSGKMGVEGVLVCTLSALSSFGPVVALANLGASLTQVFASADRVLDLLDEQPVTADVTDGADTAFAGAEAQHVSFAYADEEVLHDLSLTIPEKKIVGITGRSGSGKSTFLRLLMRFWDVSGGSIRFGTEDIRKVNTAALRAQESLVTQETELFDDTIENNIRIAKRDATREEVEAACKKASLDGFIRSLPKGYDTPVGELGGALSGGERQRIGVARAFLHDAPFLLLDEPTSNLDSLNEGVILKAVRDECKDKTVLLVSHRRSTMAAADVSFSVESGRLS